MSSSIYKIWRNHKIEELFKKHDITSNDEKEKVQDILHELKDKEVLEKSIKSFTDKMDLAHKIISWKENNIPVMPLYYDKACIWWRWNSGKFLWEMIDEVDLMNYVTWSSPANTINSKERSEIIQAFKQVARANQPIEAKTSWIQFGDEVVDLETGDRFTASSCYFLTNPLPFKLGKSEDTPNIDRIFSEWVGEDNVLLLKEIIAYCMIRDYPIHRIFCFIGSGLNGKSKYLEFLRRFIGGYNVCATELDTLLNSRFEVTRLHKKLVCQMGETNFNEMNKTSLLKKLSGDDLINFEYKNKNPFEDKNSAKILIATNNLPTTTDKTKGFYRRWIIVDFPNEFSEKKDILSEIPEAEYNNLGNQLIRILMDLLKKREFHNEGSIDERMAKYESKSNFLETFLKDSTIRDDDSYITKSDFSKKFISWCKENRHREMSETSIGISMKKLGISSSRKWFDWVFDGKGGQLRVWEGLKWSI